MKQFKIFAMLMMLMFTACNDDFLNVDPLDRYSDAAVWTDKARLSTTSIRGSIMASTP